MTRNGEVCEAPTTKYIRPEKRIDLLSRKYEEISFPDEVSNLQDPRCNYTLPKVTFQKTQFNELFGVAEDFLSILLRRQPSAGLCEIGYVQDLKPFMGREICARYIPKSDYEEQKSRSLLDSLSYTLKLPDSQITIATIVLSIDTLVNEALKHTVDFADGLGRDVSSMTRYFANSFKAEVFASMMHEQVHGRLDEQSTYPIPEARAIFLENVVLREFSLYLFAGHKKINSIIFDYGQHRKEEEIVKDKISFLEKLDKKGELEEMEVAMLYTMIYASVKRANAHSPSSTSIALNETKKFMLGIYDTRRLVDYVRNMPITPTKTRRTWRPNRQIELRL